MLNLMHKADFSSVPSVHHHPPIHLFIFTNSFIQAVNILSAYYAPGAVLEAGRDTKMCKIRFCSWIAYYLSPGSSGETVNQHGKHTFSLRPVLLYLSCMAYLAQL